MKSWSTPTAEKWKRLSNTWKSKVNFVISEDIQLFFYRQTAHQKRKLSFNIKLNLLGEKIKWFQHHLEPAWNICEPHQVKELILKYLGRFDEELEQIKLKHSIGNRKNRQHANREDIIKMTIKNDMEEYITCGISKRTK